MVSKGNKAYYNRDSKLSWKSWGQAALIIVKGETLPRVWPIVIVVWLLLSAINEGNLIIEAKFSVGLLFREIGDALVPYVVSSLGLLSSTRDRD